MSAFIKRRRLRLLCLLIFITTCFYFTICHLKKAKRILSTFEEGSSQQTYSSGMTLPLKMGINAAAKMARNLLKSNHHHDNIVALKNNGRNNSQLLINMEDKLDAQNQLVHSLQNQIKTALGNFMLNLNVFPIIHN